MRIVIDLTSLADNFTGIERYAACISREMIKQSAEEYVLIFKEKIHASFVDICEQKNVEPVVLKPCHKLLFNQIRLPWALRKYKADWYLFLAFPVPVLLFKKNMISTIHDICCWDCPETMNGLSKWYFRISHRVAMWKCRYIITISEFSKKRIVERLKYRKEKLLLVYCGIDEKFRRLEITDEKRQELIEKYQLPDRYLLSLSTLEPRKNLSLLIRAYAKLIEQKQIETPLVLAGRKGWKMDSFLEGISESVRSKIIITGFIEDEDLPYIYQQADLFVFPSMYEGFGIPPLEAMACGVPVLSSDAASMPEVLGDAAYYFQSGDADMLAKCLKEMSILSNKGKQSLTENGASQVLKYMWNVEAKKLLEHLQCK